MRVYLNVECKPQIPRKKYRGDAFTVLSCTYGSGSALMQLLNSIDRIFKQLKTQEEVADISKAALRRSTLL